jgi:iron complex outermembrane recepter protein
VITSRAGVRSSNLLLAGGFAVAIGSPAVFSADAGSEVDEHERIGSMLVTGTHIPNRNLTSISPVVSVDEDAIAGSGLTRVEDVLNRLPQVSPDQGGNISNEATGTATVDLRGLGPQRTLILVNGRRLMPGDPTRSGVAAADINQVPAALVERIDVLTGGASAVYGADAVAGVVNFVMKDDFDGMRLDVQRSLYQHRNDSSIRDVVAARGFRTPDVNVRDGYGTDVTFLLGINSDDGRSNVTFYGGYRDLSALKQSERDYSACALRSGDVFTCGGSDTTSPALFIPIEQATAELLEEAYTIGPGDVLIPYDPDLHQYNFGPANYLQRPDERYTAGFFARSAFNERVELHAEFAFMRDTTTSQVAPGGAFLGQGNDIGGHYTVNCDNPFLSASELQILCTDRGLTASDDALVALGKRNVEGTPRQVELEHTSYRAVLGSRGQIAPGWDYDVYGSYGTTLYDQGLLNDFSATRIGRALLAVDNGAGEVECRANVDADPTNDDPSCVPYNLFRLGGITPEQVDYLQTPAFSSGRTTEIVASALVIGDLGQHGVRLPWASGGIGIALGAEYRREESEFTPDALLLTGDISSETKVLPTSGSFDVSELFIEARAPILQDKPAARLLEIEAGYRYSDYSLGFATDTYKLGANWAITDDVRFRAGYQRAVRAPNIQELFVPQRVDNVGYGDPCANGVDGELPEDPNATAENCTYTGVPLDRYGTIVGSVAGGNALVGGQPLLQPETADTWTFGIVLTPRAIEGLSLSVDYYDIDISDVVGTYGSFLIVNNCLTTHAPSYCSLIHRDPATLSLWLGENGYVVDVNVNTGSRRTRGVDLDASYHVDIGAGGELGLQLIGTYVRELVIGPIAGFPTYDCKGYFGFTCGVPTPRWRHQARVTWSSPFDLDLTLTWRYVEAVVNESTSTNPQLAFFTPATDGRIPSASYLDLAASYAMNVGSADLVLSLGVNNIADKSPPLLGGFTIGPPYGNGNAYAQFYDPLGRYAFFGMSAQF